MGWGGGCLFVYLTQQLALIILIPTGWLDTVLRSNELIRSVVIIRIDYVTLCHSFSVSIPPTERFVGRILFVPYL